MSLWYVNDSIHVWHAASDKGCVLHNHETGPQFKACRFNFIFPLFSSPSLFSPTTSSMLPQTELLYYVFGREKFPHTTTANLERFMRRFNEVQYWVVTELCLCVDLAKRAALLKKFIKMAIV